MSKAKDRARAESGRIFRDGKLWNREDWVKLHPSPPVVPAQFPRGSRAPLEVVSKPPAYYCDKCKHPHKLGSKIYEAHEQYGIDVLSVGLRLEAQ